MCERILVETADLHHFEPYLNGMPRQVSSVEVRLATQAYERPDGKDALKLNLIINEVSTPIELAEIVLGNVEFVAEVMIGCKACEAVLVTREVKTIIAGLTKLPIRLENA